VTAEHAGFRSVVSQEQKLLINQALRIDFKMGVGAATQTVEVGAEAAPVETVNPTEHLTKSYSGCRGYPTSQPKLPASFFLTVSLPVLS
jgi:hypothetical protein